MGGGRSFILFIFFFLGGGRGEGIDLGVNGIDLWWVGRGIGDRALTQK